MTDTTDDPTRPDNDPTHAVPVATAAAILGITSDAVRARIRRGKLRAVKRDNVWHVIMPPDQFSKTPTGDATGPDNNPTSRDTHDATAPTPPSARDDALIEQLQSENAYLRDQLDTALRTAERERERADVIAQLALQRIEQLTATTPDASDAPVRDDPPDRGSGDPHAPAGRTTTLLVRLRRLFSRRAGPYHDARLTNASKLSVNASSKSPPASTTPRGG